MEAKKGFSWGNLILGILFIVTSLVAFNDPVGNLETLVILFAIFAIIKGIYEIFVRNMMKYYTGTKATSLIVLGVIDVLIGIFLFFNINAGVLALPFVFAAWFLFDSLVGLFTADSAKSVSNSYYWFTIIINILGVILGVALLFNPLSAALTLSFLVGFYFMLFGIINIVDAFSR